MSGGFVFFLIAGHRNRLFIKLYFGAYLLSDVMVSGFHMLDVVILS